MEEQRPPGGVAPDAGSPAARLRERAASTDRTARFGRRLAEVEAVRRRRRRRRALLGVLGLVAAGGSGVLAAVLVAAARGAASPGGAALLLAACAGAGLAAVGAWLRGVLARRRGPAAWDPHLQRHVLFGAPAEQVRAADRPRGRRDDPPPPVRRPPTR